MPKHYTVKMCKGRGGILLELISPTRIEISTFQCGQHGRKSWYVLIAVYVHVTQVNGEFTQEILVIWTPGKKRCQGTWKEVDRLSRFKYLRSIVTNSFIRVLIKTIIRLENN